MFGVTSVYEPSIGSPPLQERGTLNFGDRRPQFHFYARLARERGVKLTRKEVIFMAKSAELTRDERIKKELSRLRRSLKDVPKNKMTTAEGLLHRAAFLRVELEDLEADINANGSTELYQNGPDALPMTRIRAAAQQHNTMMKNYTTVCRQLADLIPESATATTKKESDAFVEILQRKNGMRRVK